MSAVVQPDADDLLRVGHRCQQLDIVERQRGAVRALELGDAAGGEERPHPLAAAPERIPRVDHTVVASTPTREPASDA